MIEKLKLFNFSISIILYNRLLLLVLFGQVWTIHFERYNYIFNVTRVSTTGLWLNVVCTDRCFKKLTSPSFLQIFTHYTMWHIIFDATFFEVHHSKVYFEGFQPWSSLSTVTKPCTVSVLVSPTGSETMTTLCYLHLYCYSHMPNSIA